jgi:predicted MFS family arabinose efflux permease
LRKLSGAGLVALVCAAQVLAQIGAYSWPALLPEMMDLWGLSNSEAGWITGIFYLSYIAAVPLLVTSTDRIDAKRVYLFGVGCTVASHLLFSFLAQGFWSALTLRALAGIGWAGTYMTGLKLLADQVNEKMVSRAVSGHAASIGISGALSYSWTGLLASPYGWQAPFLASAISAAAAWALVVLWVPARPVSAIPAKAAALFDFRPVLRNRSGMAYSLAYCVHTLEMNALRGWGVAFLAFVAIQTGWTLGVLTPTLVMTALGLIGTAASLIGNEAAIRMGRRNLVAIAMLVSIFFAALIGFLGTHSYLIAVGMLLVYGFVIWLDSSSLTAGAAGSALPSRRGATLAVHSTLGYAGGFVGPLIIGLILDVGGGGTPMNWGFAFLSVAAIVLIALAVFWAMNPAGVAGDRGNTSGAIQAGDPH